ncbi:MAG: SBBP repeat-containing protein [Bacteroidota bacterium]
MSLCALLTMQVYAHSGTLISSPPKEGVFIENKSQWNGDILFKTSLSGLKFSVTKEALIYDFFKKEVSLESKTVHQKGQSVKMEFTGSNPASFKGSVQESGEYNYFYGKDPQNWVRKARSFKTLTATNIYDGIDAVVTLDNGLPRYDFVVKPGADPRNISLKFTGADEVSTDALGNLKLATQYGSIYNGKLLAYQEIEGKQSKVECSFKITGNAVTFNCGKYDPTLPLIIDPTVYATYVGGGMDDEMTSVVVDPSGNIITAGWSASDDYPVQAGSYDITFGLGTDAVVTRFNPAITSIVSSTFIGGSGDEAIRDISIDGAGNICVVGETNSTDFPTKSGAVSQTAQGSIDVFVCRLNNTGSDLIYSTYVGGTKDEYALAMKADLNNNIYLTGKTNSTNFPTTLSVFDRTQNGSFDAFVIKIASGGSLLYSTFLGGGDDDIAYAIAVDASSNIYVAGETSSGNYPTAPIPSQFNGQSKPFDNTYNLAVDGFVVKFNSSLSTQTFSTYIGGSGDDRVRGIGLGPNDIIYIAGETNSSYGTATATNFPSGSVTTGGEKKGGLDIFAGQFDKAGKLLPFTFVMGGSAAETVKDLVMDAEGNYYITGTTTSSNFPSTTEATKKSLTGTNDGFVVKLNPNGVQNAGLVGGNKTDILNGLALDSKNNLYMVGGTSSSNFAISENPFKNTLSGSSDGFLAKEVFAVLEMISPVGGEKWCGATQQTLQWSGIGFSTGEKYALYISNGDGQPFQKIDSNLSGPSYQWIIPTNLLTGNQYRIRVVSSSGVVKESGAITISQGPSITAQPQAATICEGQPLSLSVQAISTNPSYQWYKDAQMIPGATTATYTVPNATPSLNGNYTVRITGTCSTTPVTSQVAAVAVNPATTISLHPGNVNTTVGQPINLVAAASGENNNFTWQKNGMTISGATSPTYTIPSAQKSDEGAYRAIVTGACGADTSDEAQVVVNTTSIEYSELPDGSLKIENVAPNPVATTTQILLKTTKESVVNVWIIDANGATVQEIFKGNINGNHTIPFDTKNLASGSYWVIAEQNGQKVRYELRVVR